MVLRLDEKGLTSMYRDRGAKNGVNRFAGLEATRSVGQASSDTFEGTITRLAGGTRCTIRSEASDQTSSDKSVNSNASVITLRCLLQLTREFVQ